MEEDRKKIEYVDFKGKNRDEIEKEEATWSAKLPIVAIWQTWVFTL